MMCGIVVVAGVPDARAVATRSVSTLHHRGPDALGVWSDDARNIALAHTRLSIVDLSDAALQPMTSADDRYVLVFNGEIYNHVELRSELADYPYRSRSDTEVVLAAWSRWGEACLDRFVGMFAFVLWDAHEQRIIAVRDRFGVKPMYYARMPGGGFVLASEIKAIHAAGLRATADTAAWASYLAHGLYAESFWDGVSTVPAGSILIASPGKQPTIRRWYELSTHVGTALDDRDDQAVRDEYRGLLEDSVRLRFRSDVPVGINLSGGLDSSTLLGIVHALQGRTSDVTVFTFVTNDSNYDELPWVEALLAQTRHPLVTCALSADEVPALAKAMTRAQDEPYGGIPTLAYARLFQAARARGVIVLLDGQGLDEQWGGYDYYRSSSSSVVQGSVSSATRPDCLTPELVSVARAAAPVAQPFGERLRDLQYRDLVATKIPRALRFNDRVSMAASTELREPFLDHRLVELALRQPARRKISGDVSKVMLRELTASMLPSSVQGAPKRAVQTPQREWLRGPLRSWAESCIDAALASRPSWFDADRARSAWHEFVAGGVDNSFWVWQWISLGLASQEKHA
jgi:asparagine synthase (glutamine-hydrolysing)